MTTTNPVNRERGEKVRAALLARLRALAEAGSPMPTLNTLAADIGLSEGSAVTRHMKILVAENAFSVVKEKGFVWVEFPDGKLTEPRDYSNHGRHPGAQ